MLNEWGDLPHIYILVAIQHPVPSGYIMDAYLYLE